MNVLLLRQAEKWRPDSTIGESLQISSIYPPLGLLYIGAVLEQEGNKVEIIDLDAEHIEKVQFQTKIHSADAIGIGVYTNNYKEVVELTEKIKILDQNIPIILGGPHCTFLKKKALLDIPYADIAIEAEGEQVILNVIKYLQGKKKLSEIEGLYYRERKGGVIKSGRTFKVIKDLDIIPFPARHLVEKYDYGTFPGGYLPKKKFTSMISSRGCPFKCRFCSRYSNIIKKYGFRQRSVKNVVEEILEINENYRSVAIVDDNFLADKERANKIFDNLLEHCTDIEYMILGSRVDSADRDLYAKMKKANVRFIGYGIESGNQDVLDYYNKQVKVKQIVEAVNLANEMDFFTFGSFILGAPIETKDHIENTINFACSLPLDSAIFRSLKFEMGSELWLNAEKNGKIRSDEYLTSADSSRDLGNFTPEQLKRYEEKAFWSFYLRPIQISNQIFRFIKQGDINQLYNCISWLFNTIVKKK